MIDNTNVNTMKKQMNDCQKEMSMLWRSKWMTAKRNVNGDKMQINQLQKNKHPV